VVSHGVETTGLALTYLGLFFKERKPTPIKSAPQNRTGNGAVLVRVCQFAPLQLKKPLPFLYRFDPFFPVKFLRRTETVAHRRKQRPTEPSAAGQRASPADSGLCSLGLLLFQSHASTVFPDRHSSPGSRKGAKDAKPIQLVLTLASPVAPPCAADAKPKSSGRENL
jgi:hypothetical protein